MDTSLIWYQQKIKKKIAHYEHNITLYKHEIENIDKVIEQRGNEDEVMKRRKKELEMNIAHAESQIRSLRNQCI